MHKQINFAALLTFSLSIIGVLLLITIVPQNLETISAFAHKNWLLGALLIILWRILSIVVPPIPGAIVSFSLIPIYGWFLSYVFASIGILIGASIAFFLARKYREPFVKRLIPLQQLHMWEGKLSGKTEFFAFLGIRFATGPILDFISYVAGLSKISYPKFLLATCIAILPDAILYYVGEELYAQFNKQSSYFGVLVLVILAGAYYVIRKKGFFNKQL